MTSFESLLPKCDFNTNPMPNPILIMGFTPISIQHYLSKIIANMGLLIESPKKSKSNTLKILPQSFIEKRERELNSFRFFFYYLPDAKDFSTPMMDAGIAIATKARAKFGSSSMRLNQRSDIKQPSLKGYSWLRMKSTLKP